MTNKQIVEAQKLLRLFDKTPVKVYNENGDTFWQITYDNATYSALINVVESVAKQPIKEYAVDTSPYVSPTYNFANSASITNYHRDKI